MCLDRPTVVSFPGFLETGGKGSHPICSCEAGGASCPAVAKPMLPDGCLLCDVSSKALEPPFRARCPSCRHPEMFVPFVRVQRATRDRREAGRRAQLCGGQHQGAGKLSCCQASSLAVHSGSLTCSGLAFSAAMAACVLLCCPPAVCPVQVAARWQSWHAAQPDLLPQREGSITPPPGTPQTGLAGNGDGPCN